ncbi:LysM peptidoglycan-binding domain-containing protein [Rhodococcus sp. UNC363MFTsu5.1]|uniref:LysM peptidoglycan-binding domain-containing protein n=1 Tax=Rhodococcus sp. UNC363MFTsu5.1 TaxID=1449069 RepID=UPI0012DC5486|nr:LysM peptidoglycan-binding domain-containing protein [Rhodococcus sp. UNC363MFTsu5.1]
MSMAVPMNKAVPKNTVPNGARSRQVVGRRPRVDGFVEYRRAPMAVSTAVHGKRGQEGGIGALLVGMLLSAVAVAGLLGIAQARSNPQFALGETAVVQVQGGETLSDVATRVAPGSRVEQVVARILDLNAMSGASVQAGQSLVVPVGPAD